MNSYAIGSEATSAIPHISTSNFSMEIWSWGLMQQVCACSPQKIRGLGLGLALSALCLVQVNLWLPGLSFLNFEMGILFYHYIYEKIKFKVYHSGLFLNEHRR